MRLPKKRRPLATPNTINLLFAISAWLKVLVHKLHGLIDIIFLLKLNNFSDAGHEAQDPAPASRWLAVIVNTHYQSLKFSLLSTAWRRRKRGLSVGGIFWETSGRPNWPVHFCCKCVNISKLKLTDGFCGTPTIRAPHEDILLTFCNALYSYQGLMFQEFLKKEFSHENIYFWVACEKYKKLTDSADRKHKAREIFDRHLALGALEPVNVDSYARQVTEQQLDKATPTLFILVRWYSEFFCALSSSKQ